MNSLVIFSILTYQASPLWLEIYVCFFLFLPQSRTKVFHKGAQRDGTLMTLIFYDYYDFATKALKHQIAPKALILGCKLLFNNQFFIPKYRLLV